ncbi:MAG: heavy-metal-associated domain-containing protein [Bacteroidota bacterium]
MKHILTLFAVIVSLQSMAQQSATFQVSGNCGMCKSRIEKAAKEAGATDADWNMDSKQLAVQFPSGTTLASIQQKVAAVGHDNAGARAKDDVYNKLHGCCKYDRTAAAPASEKAACCAAGESGKHDDMKSGGSCCNKPCCKDGKCANCGDCCKDGKCTKGGDCCKDNKKMSCCKDGKCSKPGHSGKDCCKKS